jgi:hypothetical protein
MLLAASGFWSSSRRNLRESSLLLVAPPRALPNARHAHLRRAITAIPSSIIRSKSQDFSRDATATFLDDFLLGPKSSPSRSHTLPPSTAASSSSRLPVAGRVVSLLVRIVLFILFASVDCSCAAGRGLCYFSSASSHLDIASTIAQPGLSHVRNLPHLHPHLHQSEPQTTSQWSSGRDSQRAGPLAWHRCTLPI